MHSARKDSPAKGWWPSPAENPCCDQQAGHPLIEQGLLTTAQYREESTCNLCVCVLPSSVGHGQCCQRNPWYPDPESICNANIFSGPFQLHQLLTSLAGNRMNPDENGAQPLAQSISWPPSAQSDQKRSECRAFFYHDPRLWVSQPFVLGVGSNFLRTFDSKSCKDYLSDSSRSPQSIHHPPQLRLCSTLPAYTPQLPYAWKYKTALLYSMAPPNIWLTKS